MVLDIDELSVLGFVREYGPLCLNELFELTFSESDDLKNDTRRHLEGLVDKGLVNYEKGMYKAHDFSEYK